MILVDTSVLVDYLRDPSEHIRKTLIEQQAAICGVTRAEILCGARTEKDMDQIMKALDGFHTLEIRESFWRPLGEYLQKLRSKGIVVPFQDALLATVAIQYDVD